MSHDGSDQSGKIDENDGEVPIVPTSTTNRFRDIWGSTIFSVLMGILAPILCLALQPFLLPGDLFLLPGLQFINTYWIFSYGFIGLEILALSLWLSIGERPRIWYGALSGVLFAGAFFAGGLGLILLPFRLLGLLILIGFLGFVPLFTAYAFYRNAVRAYRHAGISLSGTTLRASALLGSMLVMGVPGGIQARVLMVVQSTIQGVVEGDPAAMDRLRAWAPFVSRDRLVWAYDAERDPIRKSRLSKAYKDLTGEDIERRLSILND